MGLNISLAISLIQDKRFSYSLFFLTYQFTTIKEKEEKYIKIKKD